MIAPSRKRQTMKWLIPIGIGMMVFPSMAPAWEGHTWSSWLDISQAVKPVISSPQAGLSELVPLLCSAGKDSPRIDSIHDWEQKRDRILAILQDLIGQPTSLFPLSPFAEALGEQDQGTYIRRHIRIRS